MGANTICEEIGVALRLPTKGSMMTHKDKFMALGCIVIQCVPGDVLNSCIAALAVPSYNTKMGLSALTFVEFSIVDRAVIFSKR